MLFIVKLSALADVAYAACEFTGCHRDKETKMPPMLTRPKHAKI